MTPGRGAAEEVLHALIDARLLTAYEVRDEEREPADGDERGAARSRAKS